MTRTLVAIATLGGLAVIATAVAPQSAAQGDIDISGFTVLDVSAGLKVEFETAPTYSYDVILREGEMEDLRIERQGDRLIISRKRTSGWGWNDRVDATVTVTGPVLEAVDASSGSSVRAIGINAGDFDIDVSSGTSVRIAGTCETLTIDASSGASLDADELRCVDGTVDASSGASVQAYLTGRVNADASSGSSVRVDGGARRGDVDTSSGASVRIKPAPL